ncbi:TPA: aldolase [bacterium]|nr:aldolase [bacterium]
MFYSSTKELVLALKGGLEISEDGRIDMVNEGVFRERLDDLVHNAVFNENEDIKAASKWIIREAALKLGLIPSSIQGFYRAKGRGEYSHLTVPAVNIRGLAYDVACALVRAAMKNDSASFIFELARSEMEYTHQPPSEYASVVMAAALREGYSGPIFIQGDHFQIRRKLDRRSEIATLKDLIRESIEAGFYNIDIDTSTLVDLERPTVREQQRDNFEIAGEIVAYIRTIEPKGITVSCGGEIGEIGGKNSTEEELRAYLDGLKEELAKRDEGLVGISKIAIQTGTTHGGVVLPDGTIAKVKLDFDTLTRLSNVAIQEYGLAGAVQHGASTLPAEAFSKFAEANTTEVHLATEYQNMIYESELFPKDLREKMYSHLHKECAKERKEGETDEQFIYKTRKKAWGPFKEQVWNIPKEAREEISRRLEETFDLLLKRLGAANTREAVNKEVKPIPVHKPIPESLREAI